MDALVVFDCQKVLPNRFALALAAAARRRALARGAEPRLGTAATGVSELALHKIAQGVFTSDELAPFLIGSGEMMQLSSPDSRPQLRGGAAPVSSPQEAVH